MKSFLGWLLSIVIIAALAGSILVPSSSDAAMYDSTAGQQSNNLWNQNDGRCHGHGTNGGIDEDYSQKDSYNRGAVSADVCHAPITVNLLPGNDYYFKGPITLRQLKDAGFSVATSTLLHPEELFFMPNDPPLPTDSASATYYLWQNNWYRVGSPTIVDPSTKTSLYFIIRKRPWYTATTLTLPPSVTYYGSTVMNGTPRPW